MRVDNAVLPVLMDCIGLGNAKKNNDTIIKFYNSTYQDTCMKLNYYQQQPTTTSYKHRKHYPFSRRNLFDFFFNSSLTNHWCSSQCKKKGMRG